MNNDRFKFRFFDNWKKTYRYDLLVGMDGYPYEWGNFQSIEVEDKGRITIEQCTGLCDRNGRLICEGDIIECCYGKGKPDEARYKYMVLWHKYERRIVKFTISDYEWLKKKYPNENPEDLLYQATYSGIKEEFANIREIVGNIHEVKE